MSFPLSVKLDYSSLMPRIKNMSTTFNGYFHQHLGKSDPYIEIESIIYLYTVCDYWLTQIGSSEKTRTKLFEDIDQYLQLETKWIDSRFSRQKAKDIFDIRIKAYFSILLLSDRKMDKYYFQRCVDYQIQLISFIIEKGDFSKYNPVPNTIRDYSPIILDIMITSKIKHIITEYMDNVVLLILEIQNIDK